MTNSKDIKKQTNGRRTKVARLIEEHSFERMGAELERRWTTDGKDRMSLRSLATYFNQQLLEKVMSDTGLQPLSGEVENVYRLLTDDDVSGAERTRAVRRLEREGIDVETLRNNFVTHQAIQSYLKGDRNAEYVRKDRDPTVAEADNIQRLRNKLAAVAKSSLEKLQSRNSIALGEFKVLVDVRILCETCGQQYDVNKLLKGGGCACEEPHET